MSSTLESTKLMTAEELWEMPDDGFRYELVKGELIRMAPAGGEHGFVAMNLGAPLKGHIKVNNLGVVLAAETGFQLTDAPDSVRAPDISFVSRERIPPTGIPKSYWKGAPDLAVEVVSPNDKLYELDEKIDEYLAVGTKLVVVLYLKKQRVTLHKQSGEVITLSVDDTLDLNEVVPGFNFPVREIYEL